MKPIALTVPMPPNLTNRASGRSHWRVIHKEKVAYRDQLDLLLAAKMLPDPPPSPFQRATIRATMHLGAAMDDDNCIARAKPAVDWLKTRGYIVDDRRSCLRWEGLPIQIVKRDGNYRIELTLTPLDGPNV